LISSDDRSSSWSIDSHRRRQPTPAVTTLNKPQKQAALLETGSRIPKATGGLTATNMKDNVVRVDSL
jgi:hypothetical protein